MTSLDGPGFSITLLKATSEMIEYIDAPTKAIGWSVPSFPPSIWKENVSRLVESETDLENDNLIQEGGIECKFAARQCWGYRTQINIFISRGPNIQEQGVCGV
jgi:hypothetical protein